MPRRRKTTAESGRVYARCYFSRRDKSNAYFDKELLALNLLMDLRMEQSYTRNNESRILRCAKVFQIRVLRCYTDQRIFLHRCFSFSKQRIEVQGDDFFRGSALFLVSVKKVHWCVREIKCVSN